MIEMLISVASGGGAGLIVVFLLREVISTRIQKSIGHEYDTKLEDHKKAISRDLDHFRHENNMHQLRTSLFFDHQRLAFANILESLDSLCRKWTKDWEPDGGDFSLLSKELLIDFDEVVSKHTLFLDSDSEYVVKAIRERLRKISQVELSSIDQNINGLLLDGYCEVVFMKSKLAEIFRWKIGVSTKNNAIIDVVFLLSKVYLDFPADTLSTEGVVEYARSRPEPILAGIRKQLDDWEHDKTESYSVAWYTLELKKRYAYLCEYYGMK